MTDLLKSRQHVRFVLATILLFIQLVAVGFYCAVVWIVDKALQAAIGAALVGIVAVPLWLLGVMGVKVLLVVLSVGAMLIVGGLWEGCGMMFLSPVLPRRLREELERSR